MVVFFGNMIVLIGGNGNKRVRTLRFTIRKKNPSYILNLKKYKNNRKIVCKVWSLFHYYNCMFNKHIKNDYEIALNSFDMRFDSN